MLSARCAFSIQLPKPLLNSLADISSGKLVLKPPKPTSISSKNVWIFASVKAPWDVQRASLVVWERFRPWPRLTVARQVVACFRNVGNMSPNASNFSFDSFDQRDSRPRSAARFGQCQSWYLWTLSWQGPATLQVQPSMIKWIVIEACQSGRKWKKEHQRKILQAPDMGMPLYFYDLLLMHIMDFIWLHMCVCVCVRAIICSPAYLSLSSPGYRALTRICRTWGFWAQR